MKKVLGLLIILIGFSLQAQQTSSLNKGLIFNAPLSQWSGTYNLVSGVQGTATATYNVLDRQGNGGRGYVMAGAGYGEIADADRYDVGTGDFSISMKITPANITDNGKYLINKEASGVGYGIYQTANDLYIRFDDGTTDVGAIIGTDVLVANTPLEFTVVFSRAGNATLYKDRSTTSAGTVAISTASLTLSNAGAIRVGNATAGSAGFTGEISMVRLFNFALTPTQAVNYSKPEYTVEFLHIGASQTVLTSGTLTTGKRYKIIDWITTDDFTNIGGANVDGTIFTATGTTPTTWTNSSTVVQLGSTLNLNAEGMGRIGDGTLTTDRWGDLLNNLTATVSGAVLTIPPASNLGAMNFNGTSSNVAYGQPSAAIMASTRGTISFWIKIIKSSSSVGLFVLGDTNADEYLSFYLQADNKLGLVIADAGTVQLVSGVNSALSINTNYHVAIVQDGISPKFYVNGVLVASTNTTTTDLTSWMYELTGIDNIRLGCLSVNGSGNTSFFGGTISKPKMFDRALSAEEILTNYQSGE